MLDVLENPIQEIIRIKGKNSFDLVIITRMAISHEEVNHIALLARLELSGEEKKKYQQQLSDILDYVAQLQDLDTAEIAPTSSVLPPRSQLREDEAQDSLSKSDVLKNAPNAENGQFRVPPVLD